MAAMGEGTGVQVVEQPNLIERWFPNLAGSGYEVTGEPTEEFNCIAWALEITSQRWDCDQPRSYWPPSLPGNQEVWTIMRLFAGERFSVCDGDLPEPGFDKIAIYAFVGQFAHVARQLESCLWTSKLGRGPTITHNSPANLTGGFYGSVHCIMRRPKASSL